MANNIEALADRRQHQVVFPELMLREFGGCIEEANRVGRRNGMRIVPRVARNANKPGLSEWARPKTRMPFSSKPLCRHRVMYMVPPR
jgi:hypothetical protein